MGVILIRKPLTRAAVGTIVAMGGLAIAAASLGGCQAPDSTARVSYDGAAIYQGYCASCHGSEGAGDGPMAVYLTLALPDLRDIRKRSGGRFSELEVIQVIDGRGIRAAHGTQDMPVWGWAFREVERSETQVQARLKAVAGYLESIQR